MAAQQSRRSLQIIDVIVDGVSMALTQRLEFAGLIQRNGGQLAALLASLREENGRGTGSAPSR
jgi:ABC-type transporter MlaC component